MNSILIVQTLRWIWLAWVLYWFASAFRVKKIARKESGLKRLRYLLIIVVAVVIMSDPRVQVSFLNRRFMPDLLAIRAVGFAVALAGFAITVWAREHLGTYWSGRVAIKVDHQLFPANGARCFRSR